MELGITKKRPQCLVKVCKRQTFDAGYCKTGYCARFGFCSFAANFQILHFANVVRAINISVFTYGLLTFIGENICPRLQTSLYSVKPNICQLPRKHLCQSLKFMW